MNAMRATTSLPAPGLRTTTANARGAKRPCPPRGGEIGLLTCILPSEACVLTLCVRLSKGGEIIEQSQIPVYVGVKGMLEAAF
ncbi:MAG: hypothetical protein ACLTV6_12555 [Christensenellales bacterium]